jgi:hypothetical protein
MPTQKQFAALERFLSNLEWIEKSKSHVENFCKDEVSNDEANPKKDNIFSYVMPDYIFVNRKDSPNVSIMCNYRYDMEHGLAVVFDSNGNVTVGIQDIIL